MKSKRPFRELAFVLATTNNQAVKLEFSAWVQDSGSTGSKSGLILANVESTNKPTRAEAQQRDARVTDGDAHGLLRHQCLRGDGGHRPEEGAWLCSFLRGAVRTVAVLCRGAMTPRVERHRATDLRKTVASANLHRQNSRIAGAVAARQGLDSGLVALSQRA